MKLSFNKEVAKALADLFNLSVEEVHNFYKKIIESFTDINTMPSQGFVEISKFRLEHLFAEHVHEKWSSSTLIGLDLPILISQTNKPNKPVFLLGIDPLRKRKDFPSTSPQNIIIGTPYAIHSDYYRERRSRTKIYWDLIKHISLNHDVYLTDVFKIWLNDSSIDEKTKYPLNFSVESWIKLLKLELCEIDPFKIITFGNVAYEMCISAASESQKDKIVPLPHPSGRNQKWNMIISGPKTIDAKTEYLCQEFDKIVTE